MHLLLPFSSNVVCLIEFSISFLRKQCQRPPMLSKSSRLANVVVTDINYVAYCLCFELS